MRSIEGQSEARDIRGALRQAIRRLDEARVPSAALAAELLLMHVTGRDRSWLYAHPEEPLAPTADERYFTLVARRAAGVPTQYLTGKQEFWGLEFEVAPGVLIPRPETEHVVEVALERVRAASFAEMMRIADVGTGSGCLAVAFAHELRQAAVVATDISPAALDIARRNAARHEVTGRIRFFQCNLLDALLDKPGTFHLIVSNPPYVGRSETHVLPREVRQHEPEEALFAGDQGLEIYAPLIVQAERLLRPGGALVLELGYNAAPHVRALLERPAWTRVAVTNDLAAIPRVIAAERA